jgi:hypothetical protein
MNGVATFGDKFWPLGVFLRPRYPACSWFESEEVTTCAITAFAVALQWHVTDLRRADDAMRRRRKQLRLRDPNEGAVV